MKATTPGHANTAGLPANDQDNPSGTASYGRVNPKDVDTAHGAILYLDGITVSFDGFKALNNLTLDISVGELRIVDGRVDATLLPLTIAG